MFFYLSKIFAILFLPYPLALFALLAICFWLEKSRPRFCLRCVTLVLFLLSLSPVAYLLLTPLEMPWRLYNLKDARDLNDIPKADVIVVLSGMLQEVIEPGSPPEFNGNVDRILGAWQLLRHSKAP